jgi:hypothetical protein
LLHADDIPLAGRTAGLTMEEVSDLVKKKFGAR